MTGEMMNDELDEQGIERDQYLVFAVESQEFGFPAVRVREISTVLGTTAVPNAPPYIEGIVNLRGRLASVINFRTKFGFEPKEQDEDTRVIVVEQADFPVGILVDAVEEVVRIPDEAVQELPESAHTLDADEYITGVGALDDRLIIVLDVDRVLATADLAEASAMQQVMEQTREAAQEAEADTTEVEQSKETEKRRARRRRK